MPTVSVCRGPRRGWLVCWTATDGRHRVLRATRGEAAQLQAQVREQLASPQNPRKTWLEAVQAFGRDLLARNLAHGTVVELTALLARYGTVMGPTWLAEFGPEQLTEYLARRLEDVAAPTAVKDWRGLRTFARWCVRRGWLDRAPTGMVNPPRQPRKVKDAPEDREWVGLLRAVPDVDLDDRQGWHLLILLAVVTGLRRSALLAIRLAEVTIGDSDTAGVGLLRATSKGRRESLHGLPPLVNDRLATRISTLPEGAVYLFPWRAFPRAAWTRLCAAAHYRHDFHSLRRAVATRSAESAAIAAARQQLRHSDSATTTDHYLDSARVQRAVAVALVLPDLPPLPPFEPRPCRNHRVPPRYT